MYIIFNAMSTPYRLPLSDDYCAANFVRFVIFGQVEAELEFFRTRTFTAWTTPPALRQRERIDFGL